MQRKLIAQGKGGYTIYLPKNWVDGRGLAHGETVNVEEMDTGLIISSRSRGPREIVIELDDNDADVLRVLLTHTYRTGYDIIKMRHVTPAAFKIIQQHVQDYLLGFEITTSTADSCTIESVSEPTAEKFDAMVRRVFLLVQETQSLIITDFTARKYPSADEVLNQRKQQDKYVFFCLRSLVLQPRTPASMPMWELLKGLLAIEHEQHYLYDYASKKKPTVSKNTMVFLESLREFYRLLYDAYYTKDMKFIKRITHEGRDKYRDDLYALMEKSRGAETIVLSSLRTTLRLIQLTSAPVGSLITQLHGRKQG